MNPDSIAVYIQGLIEAKVQAEAVVDGYHSDAVKAQRAEEKAKDELSKALDEIARLEQALKSAERRLREKVLHEQNWYDGVRSGVKAELEKAKAEAEEATRQAKGYWKTIYELKEDLGKAKVENRSLTTQVLDLQEKVRILKEP